MDLRQVIGLGHVQDTESSRLMMHPEKFSVLIAVLLPIVLDRSIVQGQCRVNRSSQHYQQM